MGVVSACWYAMLGALGSATDKLIGQYRHGPNFISGSGSAVLCVRRAASDAIAGTSLLPDPVRVVEGAGVRGPFLGSCFRRALVPLHQRDYDVRVLVPGTGRSWPIHVVDYLIQGHVMGI